VQQPILAPSSNSDPLINEPDRFDDLKLLGTNGLRRLSPANAVAVGELLSPSGTIQKAYSPSTISHRFISAWKSARTKGNPLTVRSIRRYATISPKSSPVWKCDGGLFSPHIEPEI